MFKQDLKNNCTIFNSSFFDDMISYKLEETDSDLKIRFESSDNTSNVSFKWNELKDVVSTSLSLVSNSINVLDSWIPIIIQNDNHVLSKEIRNNCTIKKKILGIENFVQFQGLFKNWDLSNPNIKLNSNWFIHSNDIPYVMDYGILCWYKNNTNYLYDQYKDLSEFPVGSRILCNMPLTAKIQSSNNNSETKNISISTNDILIKHSKNILILTDKDDSKFNSTTSASSSSADISFNTERKIFNLSDVKDIADLDVKFKLDIRSLYDADDVFKHSSLWISNGEAYSYSLNPNRRAENYSLNIPSMSYLSPSLFYIYNAIYHRLTINTTKNDNSVLVSKKKASILKKLCYFLSTAPAIDRTTVDILYHPDIQTYVTILLNTNISSQEIEKVAILECLTSIMQKFIMLSSSLRLSSNLANNYINNKIDLFRKITTKYTPHLLIDTDTDVTYKHIIDYGPNISVRRNIRSSCDKNLSNQPGQVSADGTWTNVIYNNEKIKCQGMELSTRFNRNYSEIILSDEPDNPDAPTKTSKILPTADITRSPLGGERNLDLGPDIKVTLTLEDGYIDLSQDPPVEMLEKFFTIELQEEANGNLKDNYYWELVDGPDCLRFSDCVVDPNIFGRCAYTVRSRTSRDPFPVVYIRSRGVYTIKVTVSSHFGIQTDTLKIYVVDENNEYAPGLSPPSNVIPVNVERDNRNFIANFKNSSTYDSNFVPSDNLKCLSYNMSQFALSKINGIFWPLKTDSYVKEFGLEQTMGSTIDFRVPGMVKTEEFLYSGMKTTGDINQKLTFTIIPNNSKILWENIILEHMRGNDPECAQCESFFQETLARTKRKTTESSMWRGTSGFRRVRRSPDEVVLEKFTSEDEQFNVSPKSFVLCNMKYLPVSMIFAPLVKSYGGYDTEILNTIGISGVYSLPNHPPPSSTLPVLPQRHYFGFPENIYCHLSPMHFNNSADIIFDKGTFHHEKGWICSPQSSDPTIRSFANPDLYESVKNKDSSYKFKTDKLETFVFKGLGVYNLRSSTNSTQSDILVYPNVKTSSIKLQSASSTPWFSNDPLLEHDQSAGYRNINEYGSQEADEYIVDILNSSDTSFDCGIDTNTIVYGINRPDLNDLKIESLEVKINNLNYPNSKHLCVWLEVERDEPLPLPKDKLHTNFTDLSNISNLPLREYIQNITNMNMSNNPKKRRLYLLNRDNIDNFMYNFSIKFSDDAPFFTTSDYTSIFNLTHNNSKNLFIDSINIGSNESSVKPTITANGYSDVNSVIFKESIINNKLFDINNTLSKFNNIPMNNTRFTLYIGVYDDYDNFTIRDNTTLNNVLLGTISTNMRRMPNILSNAICSWDLIIHTNKVPKPVPSDPIGLIDRKSNSPSFNRCNFIANFKNKKHLIPQANINAPYKYIANVNDCRYKEKEFSTVTRFNSIEFPTWAFLQISAAMTPIYGGGGFVFTGDPSIGFNAIYEYFVDLRQQAQTEAQVRKIQRGRYTDFGFGQPDKALINISQDGNVWYKLEVPIYRYSNSVTLIKNKYQYIKLSNNVFPFLSRFEYSFLEGKDLDFLPVLSSDAEENIRIINDFWKTNNIAEFSTLPTKERVSGQPKRFIKIKGSRAYHLFDKNEQISISSPTKTDPDNMATFTIQEKGIIVINNQDYTVFYVNSNIDQKTYLTKTKTDTIVIFKNDYSTKEENNPFNKWGLEKPVASKKIPDRHFNTLGEGSYGRGTEFLRESVFSYLENDNRVEPIYNMINHKEQYLFKFNKATIYKPDNTIVEVDIADNATKEQTIRGFPWALTEAEKQTIKNYIMFAKVSPGLSSRLKTLAEQKGLTTDVEKLRQIDRSIPLEEVKKMFLADLKAYSSFIEPDDPNCTGSNCLQKIVKELIEKREAEISIFYSEFQNYTFMDIRCDRFTNTDIPNYGEIVIENDWIIDQPKNQLSDEDITRLTDRINFLKTKTKAFENILKEAQKSEDFPFNISLDTLNPLSIPDLITYLSALSSESVDCNTINYTDELCRMSFTKRLISDRTEEINELSNAINTNNRYSIGILPIVKRFVEAKSHGVLSVKEELDTDHYWVVIDPEQGCSLSKNMTAKVWTQIKQECVGNKSTVGGTPIFAQDTAQLCPAPPNQDLKIRSNDLDIETRVAYIRINNLKAEEQKATYYPGVSEWQKITYSSSNIDWADKYIWINGGTTDNGYPVLDTVVAISEEFEIPANARPNDIHKVKDVIDINNLDSIRIRFGNIPRKVKEYDRNYSRYVPNFWGRLVKGFPSRGNGGEPWYSYDCWSCFNTQGNYVPLPDQYKMMNEMLFRSYFGSVDGIEHKNSLLSDTKESWEWIPYEYDKDAERDY